MGNISHSLGSCASSLSKSQINGPLFIAILSLILICSSYIAYASPFTGGDLGGQYATVINMTGVTDLFFYDGDTIPIIANYTNLSDGQGYDGLTVSGNFSPIGGASDASATALSGNSGLYKLNSTVNFSSITVNNIQSFNISISAYNGTDYINTTVNALIVNMSSLPRCPPPGVQLPPEAPLSNWTMVGPIAGCNSTCNPDEGPAKWNGTDFVVCGPNFAGDTTNFSYIAKNGNFSSVPLVLDIPGKAKINFTTPVDIGTEAKMQSILEFAAKLLSSGGKIGFNSSEYNGLDPYKPNLNLSAKLTIYNITGLLGITNKPSIGYQQIYTPNGSAPSIVCPPSICSPENIIWDSENITFTITHFSTYVIGSANYTLTFNNLTSTTLYVDEDVNASHILNVTNHGNTTETYNMSVNGTGSLNVTQITLNPDESTTILLNVSNSSDGTYHSNITGILSTDSNIIMNSFEDIGHITTIVNASSAEQNDSYEPDNNYTHANWIATDNTPQPHTFVPAGDVDWIKFNATENAIYIIQTSALGDGADTLITLYEQSGTTNITENDDVESGVIRRSKIIWTATGTGTYFVQARDWNPSHSGGSYNISITELPDITLSILGNSNRDVQKGGVFNITLNVSCAGINCTGLEIYLDPEKQKPSKPQYNPREDINMLNRLDSLPEGEYDVIIMLTYITDEVLKNSKSKLKSQIAVQGISPKLEARKQAVDNRQNAVLSRLSTPQRQASTMSTVSQKFTLKRKYNVINALSGKITKQGLEALKNDPNVESVQLSRKLSIMLSSSVPQINANDAWATQYKEVNITGEGQTICVLDTGINYNHSDFGDANGFPSAKIVGGYDFVNNDNDPWDDHGHGSHCAGIAASQDTIYKGIAPDAKIVAMKVMDSSGNGDSPDIIAGIDWCVYHAEELNISVISMSLGGGIIHYQDHTACDSESMAIAINYANDLGFIVAVAAGNDGWTDGVSFPACASGATTVSSIDKDDTTISSFSNRGLLTNVLAPGRAITATNYGGGHISKDGTSMATPHAAGAAALLNQYYRQHDSLDLHAEQIETALEESGATKFDSGSGLNLSRVDVLAALSEPIPKGIISTEIGATPFYTIDDNPNITSLDAGTSKQITWLVNATGDYATYDFFAFTDLDDGENEVTSNNVNITIVDNTYPLPNIESPQADAMLNDSIVEFIFNVTDDFDSTLSCSLYMNGQLNQTNNSVHKGITTNFTKSLDDGNYSWYINCTDAYGNNNSTTPRNLTVDATHPAFSDYKRTPDTPNEDQDVQVNVTLSQTPNTVILEWNTITNHTVTTNTGLEYYFTIINGTNYTAHDNITYYWYANDTSGNMNRSAQQSFTVANQIQTVSAPALNHTTPQTNDILNCTGGTSSDNDDEDSESARYYRWHNNSIEISGQISQTLDLSLAGLNKGDMINCSIRVSDNYNNSTWVNSSNTATIQNTAPKILIQNTFINATDSHTFNVTAGIQDIDDSSDITATNISSSSGSCINIANSTSGNYFNSTWNCSGTALVSTSIVIGFTDADNSYIETASSSNTYPNQKPTITGVDVTPNGPVQLDDLTCTVTGYSDADSDTANYYYEWYNNSVKKFTFYTTKATNILDSGNTCDGETWNCTVIPTDSYKNGTALYDSVTIGIDNPPTTTQNLPVDNYNTSSIQVTFNCSTTDDNNLANITLYGNWNGWHPNETIATTGTSNSTIFTKNLSDGTYSWNCLSHDNSSQSDWADSNRTFTIDNTPPASDSPNDASYGQNTAQNITWTLADNFAAGYYYVTRNSTVQNQTTTWTNNTPVAILINTSALGDWNYTIFFNDSLGTQGIPNEVIITITDITKPTITIESPKNQTYTNQSIWFNVTLDKTGSWCGYSLDSASNITLSNDTATHFYGINSTMTDTSHSVIFYCNDTAGNMNSTAVIYFTIDIDVPSVTFTPPTPNTGTIINVNYIYINWTVTEDNPDTTIFNWNGANTTVITTYYNKTDIADGTYTYFVWTNNSASNTNQTETRTITIDTNPGVVINLSTNANLTINGIDASDLSGYSVCSGDINGDGKADIIIGAYEADPNGNIRAGETYVVYGGVEGTINLSTHANLTINGIDAYDSSSHSISSGDINGDGKDDVIIGAYNATSNSHSQSGKTYVVYGGVEGTINLSTGANLTINGIDDFDHSGYSVSSGDINGDGKDDVIIGAYGAGPNGNGLAGETYVVYGGVEGTINLSTHANLTINGIDAGDISGRSVSSGDINGDGKDDIIIGAHYADPNGNNGAGETYIVYGGVEGTINLSTHANLTIKGIDFEDYSGHSISSGNINGDGKDDIIIGAHYADPNGNSKAGETYVVYGGMEGTINLSTHANLTIKGIDTDDESGRYARLCDFNGDGKDDIIISAHYANPNGNSYAGETYVVYGGVEGTINLSTDADITINGIDANDFSGHSISTGDINGDGNGDIIIGAYYADPNGNSNAGETYVIYGTGPPNIEFTYPTEDSNATINKNWTLVNITICDTDSDTLIFNWNGTNYTHNSASFNGISPIYWFSINKTDITDGTYTYYVWINDTAGNTNQTEPRTITIDITAPDITIQTPQNQTYNTQSICFNVTSTDTLSITDTCIYSLDGASNITLSNDTATHFYGINSTMTDTQHSVIFYCNDTAGNMNQTETIYFTIDTTLPTITILSPHAQLNYSTQTIPFNITANENISWCGYSLDSAPNTTMSPTQNNWGHINTSMTEAQHTVKFYCNDTAGNMANTTQRTFTIDTTPPIFNTPTPANNSRTNTDIILNATDSGTGVATVKYSVNSSANVTSSTIPITSLTEGTNTIDAYAQDYAGNINHTEYTYTKDTTPPAITINHPTNSTETTTNSTELNYTISELPHTIWYIIDNIKGTLDNTTLSGNQTINFTYITGKHTLYLYANDSTGNIETEIIDIKQNIQLNMSNYTQALENSTEATVNITGNISGTITTNESVWINQTLNMTLNITDTIVKLKNFHGLDADWQELFEMNNTNTTIQARIQGYGTKAGKMVYLGRVNKFLRNKKYNGTVTFSPHNSSVYTEIMYCPDDEAISCTRIGACINDAFNGTACYTDRSTNITVHVPHFSSVILGNDTIAPQITIDTPTGTETNGFDIGINLTVTEDTDTCNYSLNYSALTDITLTKINATHFTSTISPYLPNSGYALNITCTDANNNTNTTNKTFTIYDNIKPRLSTPSVSKTTSSATITWTTDEKTDAMINYSTTSSLGTNLSNIENTTSHSITISGLASSTQYHYNITSCDLAGNCNTTGTHTLTTAASGGSDVGSGTTPSGPSSGPMMPPKYEEEQEENDVPAIEDATKDDSADRNETKDEPEEDTLLKQEAEQQILLLEQEITTISSHNPTIQKEITDKLENAKKAFNAGDYANAKQLASEALKMIEQAKLDAESKTEDRKTQMSSLHYLLIAVIIIVLVLAIAYRKRKRDTPRPLTKKDTSKAQQQHKLRELEDYLNKIRPIIAKLKREGRLNEKYEARLSEIDAQKNKAKKMLNKDNALTGEQIQATVNALIKLKNDIETKRTEPVEEYDITTEISNMLKSISETKPLLDAEKDTSISIDANNKMHQISQKIEKAKELINAGKGQQAAKYIKKADRLLKSIKEELSDTE